MSPESLLTELGGSVPEIRDFIHRIRPMIVSFDTLATIDGWIVDLGSGEANSTFDDPTLHPDQRAINGLLVACDYAVRRGAETPDRARSIIRRESPIAFANLSRLCESLRALIELLAIGISFPPAFQRRRRGHALSGKIRSDPALSFEHRSMDQNIGDNTISSLTVHNESSADRVQVVGELNERWGVEIGLDPKVSLEQVVAVEREAATVPSFLHGVTSYPFDDGIVVGWRRGFAPKPDQLGVAIQAWTKALFDLPTADVRLVFAPPTGESTELTEMRARSAALRMYRDATVRAVQHPE